MLKTIYHKADEKTVRKTYASIQQSLATITTHLDPTLNTRSDHSDNREGAETCPRPEDVDLEEVSIDFLLAYSVHPNWKQIISACNGYGQTMAHISVTLGYLRLLQHLFTWEIDLNVVDNLGLTALHYAYLFKHGGCAEFLIQSGVNQFILDDLGRSPSDLEPSLEVSMHSVIGIDSESHADGSSPIERNTEMPDKAGKLYAKYFLVQQWMRQDEDGRMGEMPPSRCSSPENLGRPSTTSGPPDAPNYPFSSLAVHSPGENSTPIVEMEEMDLEASIEIAAPDIVHPLSPISEASVSAPHLEGSTVANVLNQPHRTTASPQVVLLTEGGHSLAPTFTPSVAVPSQSDSLNLCICNDDYWFSRCSLAWEHYNVAMSSPLPFTPLPCTCQPRPLNGAVSKSCPKATDHLLTWVSYI